MPSGKPVLPREPVRDQWNRSLNLSPTPVATQPAYLLRVPLGPDHWISITSNKSIEIEHFRVLNRYLSLQREMLGEDETPSGQGE